MNKKVKQEISQINQKLTKLLDSGVMNKAQRCDFLDLNLKNVKIKVSKITPVFIQDNFGLTIEYKIDPITIYIDNGNVFPNESFKSINLLNLISFEDMQKIQKKIEDIVALQKQQEK